MDKLGLPFSHKIKTKNKKSEKNWKHTNIPRLYFFMFCKKKLFFKKKFKKVGRIFYKKKTKIFFSKSCDFHENWPKKTRKNTKKCTFLHKKNTDKHHTSLKMSSKSAKKVKNLCFFSKKNVFFCKKCVKNHKKMKKTQNFCKKSPILDQWKKT